MIDSDRFPHRFVILRPQTINRLRAGFAFDLTVLTQDWHPANHVSFWANHRDDPNAHLFQPLYIPGVGEQMMWPVHCVQNSTGAEFHPLLTRRAADVVVQKGQNPDIDSYSGFFDNGHRAQTPMDSILKQHGACQWAPCSWQQIHIQCGVFLQPFLLLTFCDRALFLNARKIARRHHRRVRGRSGARLLRRLYVTRRDLAGLQDDRGACAL